MPPPPVVPTAAFSPLQGYGKLSENAMSHPSISPSVQQTASSTIIRTNSGPVLARAPSAHPLQSQILLPSTAQTQAYQLPIQTSNVAFHTVPHGSEPSPPASALYSVPWSDPHGPSSTPPAAPSTDPIEPTIASVAKLYQLPVEELESTVASILREPGFEEFVCNLSKPWRDSQILIYGQIGKLDKMWALHGFLRR
jgi:hypothetical protein